jgi:hypothetical protein
MKATMKKKTTITIEFDNKKAAEHWASWLCGAGEQDYWDYMRYREEDEEKDNITVISFHYHGSEDETKAQDDAARYGGFMCDNTIRTICGRMDKR